MNCWKNPHGPSFRPELLTKSKIKRVSPQTVAILDIRNSEYLSSINNVVSQSLENKTDLNNSNFDIQELFSEELTSKTRY